MKKILKSKTMALLIVSVLSLTICLSGCGSSGDSNGTNGGNTPKVAGETQTWGNLTVLVPEGMKLVGGDLLDENNQDALIIQANDDPLKFVSISIKDEETIDMGLEMTREMNTDCPITDITDLKLANGTFTGFSYVSYDITCVQLKGDLGGKFLQVGSNNFESNDEVFQGIIGSVVAK